MLSLVRPTHLVPIHGEYRQLARHARVGRSVCAATKVLLAENGDVIRFDDEEAGASSCRQAVLIDGTRSGEVGDEVLRDQHMAPGRPRRAGGRTGFGKPSSIKTPDVDTLAGSWSMQKLKACSRRFRPCWPARSMPRAWKSGRDPGLIKEKIRVEYSAPVLSKAFGPTAARAAGGDGDLSGEVVVQDSRSGVAGLVGRAVRAKALIWLISLASYSPPIPSGSLTPGRGCTRRTLPGVWRIHGRAVVAPTSRFCEPDAARVQ